MTTNNLLSTDIHLGYVHLVVTNLERSIAFYKKALGLQVHLLEGHKAYLGAGGDDLLVLTEVPDAVYTPGCTGLYHFALLMPSRLVLAQVLMNLIQTKTALDGMADHDVSEAIYLSDPDKNGIEIYCDRPRSTWIMENNQIKMGTKALDYHNLLEELKGNDFRWDGLPNKTKMGHIHLHVAHLSQAELFYTQTLGFDLMLRYGNTALFLAVGGYHHHLGLNTWNGVGAPPPPPNAVGLQYFVIQLPNNQALDKLKTRLDEANVTYQQEANTLLVDDLAKNKIKFVVLGNK